MAEKLEIVTDVLCPSQMSLKGGLRASPEELTGNIYLF